MPSSRDTDAAVDPPIPVPDVAGADATPVGLPRRVDLTLRQRLIVDSRPSPTSALRTAIASLARRDDAAHRASAPRCAASESRAERDHLRFYAELARAQDPDLSFPAPTELPRVSSRPANPVAEWMAKGSVHNIRFNSSFEAVNPAVREQWRGYERNNVVHAQHWRHDDGPHPTLCVIHGFMGSPYLFNGLFFSLPWFYRSGYDVLLYTLPFHGRARRKGFALQRLRLFRPWLRRLRRGDGPGRARLPFGARLSRVHRRRPDCADRACRSAATPRR